MAMATPELAVAEPTPEPPAPAESRRPMPPWGWLPAVGVLALSLAVLSFYDVSLGDTARFTAYILLALAVPGTLLWRALRGGPGHLAADVAAGTVLGYAIEALAYVAAKAVGVPLLWLAVPATTIAVFLAVPGLRRFWRGSGERAPVWWSCVVSAFAAGMVIWSAASFYRVHDITEPATVPPYLDMPFHLALAGEVKHHFPPITPYVTGESLNYHWFVYTDLAATSWATGIELETLLYRFGMLPMLVLTTVLVATLGRVITRRWWAGPVAVGITFLSVAPNPFRWIGASLPDASPLGVLWLSPTQTFGMVLFAALALVLVELLRGERGAGTAGRWVLVALLLAAVTGAKATYLPLLLCALLVVLVGHAVARRGLHRAALAAFGLTAAALMFSQVVIFKGTDGGLAVEPLVTFRSSLLDSVTGLTGDGETAPVGSLIFLFGLGLICWVCMWAGAIGLLRRRSALADPAHLLCLGIGAAGLGAALALSHPGLSQMYFLLSARPYLGLLAAAGLVAALPETMQRPRTALLLLPVALAGIGAIWLLRVTGDDTAPTRERFSEAAIMTELARPYLLLLGLVGLVALGLFLARKTSVVAGVGLAVVLVLMSAFGVHGVRARQWPIIQEAIDYDWRGGLVTAGQERHRLPLGAVAAGRWLRDHSSPNDLVATNGHCRAGRT
ncbi:MAG TPA: hypothetical protein VFR67_15775, partial [Pilimelia sp.]|nr:hypothetical protein [Pilimelia sp.]